MEIAQAIYDFFGFEVLGSSATFTDLLSSMFQIGTGLWVVIFIIRSLFMAVTIPERFQW